MKTLFGLGLIMLLSGCVTTYNMTSTHIKYIDLNDFFMSESNSVSFEHKRVGNVYSFVKSGFDGGWRGYKFIEATPTEALQALYMEAIKIEANGIINLEIKYHYKKEEITGVSASGMAIKK